jgi:hypothetical protein
MDATTFDLLTRVLGRRAAVRAALGLVGLGGAVAGTDNAAAGPTIAFCEAKTKGARCRRGRQCCSGRCKRKKGKHKGRCRCSPLGARCATLDDCCPPAFVNAVLPACSVGGASVAAVCCMPEGAACQRSDDCCGGSECVDRHCSF